MAKRRRNRGEGSIEELPSGKVRATRYGGRGADGKPVRERKTFPPGRKSDALAWLRRAAEEKRGEWARRTLSDWLDRWLGVKAGELEPASLKWYRDRITRRLKPGLGHHRLGDLAPIHVSDWMRAMASAGASNLERHGALKTLRAALRSAVDMGQLSRNVAKDGVRLPKLKARSFVVWTQDQAAAFLAAAAGSELEAFWWVALETGMRPGELFGLHWPGVNGNTNTVDVRQALEWINKETPRLKEPKTEAGIRTLPVTDATMNRLRAHRERMRRAGRDVTAGPVFLNRWGTWLRLKETGTRLKQIARAAGVPPLRLYDLRHTSATILLAGGVNIKVVSQRLGHTDIAITLRHYAGFMPAMQERVLSTLAYLGSKPTGNPQWGERVNTIGDTEDYVI